MFVAGDKYSRKVVELFASEEPLDVAIAFWGDGAQAKALSKGNAERRIICNLGSGGTNPKVIKALCDSTGITVQKLDNLHAKVVIGKNVAIVGSANFSANGLGLEDGELAHWEEAGYIVTNPKELRSLRKWFKEVWEQRASDISSADFKNAEEAWKKRRAGRPKPATPRGGFAITQGNWRMFKDREVNVIVWARYPNDKEQAAEEKDRATRQDALSAKAGGTRVRLPYDYYHDWDDEIAAHRHGVFIDVHWMSRSKRFDCLGARRSIEGGHSTPGGKPMDVLEKISRLGELRFSTEEKAAFTRLMNSMPTDWYGAQCEERGPSFVIPLNDILNAKFGRSRYGAR